MPKKLTRTNMTDNGVRSKTFIATVGPLAVVGGAIVDHSFVDQKHDSFDAVFISIWNIILTCTLRRVRRLVLL